MKIITLQNKLALDTLRKGKTYYANYNKISFKSYRKQWMYLAKLCGFKECPIFCALNEEIITSSGLSKNNENVLLTLDVPDSECYCMSYYDFSDYLYYSSGQECDNPEEEIKHPENYISISHDPDDIDNPPVQVVINRIEPKWVVNSMNESLLLEKSRQQLINQSKSADKTKSYGTTRYDRKDMQHVFNTVEAFNRVDMNALWKADLLSFLIPIHGETNDYTVEVLFEGVCSDIQKQVKSNNNKFEYKCAYRAIISAINKQDIYIGCSCPDYKYRFQYWGTKDRYNSMKSQLVPARFTNPNNSKGAGCKHIMKVLADLDWALKLASCITNYVFYMKEHYEDKYASIIFPAVYGMSYDKAVQLGLFDEENDELADTMDNDDTSEIDQANAEGEDIEEVPEEEEEVES